MRTSLTTLLGVEHPILNAPMTPQAGGALARAVAEAGGFGMLGFDEDETRASLEEQVALAWGHSRLERARFGIGLVRWVLDRRPELIEMAIAAQPALVSISFGDPAPFVARFHDAGILVASQVQSKAWAETALAAGVDLLVAQGTEGGGHTGNVGTLPLLQIVLDLAGSVPVAVAGGVATGRGLAAVLAAGAGAGWIGTPFLLAAEARSNAAAQARLAAVDETQTVLTSAFDRVQHKAWPSEFRGRALRNDFTDAWNEREDGLTTEAEQNFYQAKADRNYDIANLYAGQSVGLVREVRAASNIVRELASGAECRLRAAAELVGA
jgi:nitronate monooxygenase